MRNRVLILSLLCCFCLLSQAEALTTVQWYVDPDASGGGTGVDWTNAYNSRAAWEAAEGKDITVDTGSDEIFVVNHRSSSGGDDTTMFRLQGYTTSAPNYILFTGDSANGGDFPTDGKWDETKYLFHNNDSDEEGFENREDFIYLDQLQFKVTQTGTNTRRGYHTNSQNSPSDLRISNCIFRGVVSGTGICHGIDLISANSTIRIWNNVVYDFYISADTQFVGIYIGNASTAKINHNTVYNCTVGIQRANGTVDVSSCIVGNNDDDFVGTFNSIVNCCQDDGDDVSSVSPNTNWDTELVDPDNGDRTLADFNLETVANSIGAGENDPFSDGFGDPDVAKTARTSIWDIGAFELVAALPTGGQVIMIQMSMIPLFLIFTLVCFIRGKENGK